MWKLLSMESPKTPPKALSRRKTYLRKSFLFVLNQRLKSVFSRFLTFFYIHIICFFFVLIETLLGEHGARRESGF
jgi:hypothetical protein